MSSSESNNSDDDNNSVDYPTTSEEAEDSSSASAEQSDTESEESSAQSSSESSSDASVASDSGSLGDEIEALKAVAKRPALKSPPKKEQPPVKKAKTTNNTKKLDVVPVGSVLQKTVMKPILVLKRDLWDELLECLPKTFKALFVGASGKIPRDAVPLLLQRHGDREYEVINKIGKEEVMKLNRADTYNGRLLIVPDKSLSKEFDFESKNGEYPKLWHGKIDEDAWDEYNWSE